MYSQRMMERISEREWKSLAARRVSKRKAYFAHEIGKKICRRIIARVHRGFKTGSHVRLNENNDTKEKYVLSYVVQYVYTIMFLCVVRHMFGMRWSYLTF